MAVGKPDEYQHNNEDRAYVDSDFVRGGGRYVPDRAALYALAAKADQLKEHVSVVRVLQDADNGGLKTKVVLVDLANAGNARGWELDGSADAPAPRRDRYYFLRTGPGTYAPYPTLASACATVPVGDRPACTVNVAGEEWWWKPTDLTDAGLVAKYAPGAPAASPAAPAAVPTVPFAAQVAVVVRHGLGYVPHAEVFNSAGVGMDVPTLRLDADTLGFYFNQPTSGEIIFAPPAAGAALPPVTPADYGKKLGLSSTGALAWV